MMNEDRPDAFKSVSRKPGLQIWTINVSVLSASLMSHTLDSCIIPFIWVFILQKLKMVPVAARNFGYFFDGDCYIVLNVS